MSIFQRLLSLLKPPTFADPEENRLARNLHNFLGIVGAFTLLVTPILVYAAVSPEEKRMVLLLDGGWVLSTPVFLWMIRRRRVRLAGYLYTSLTFFISLVFIFRYYDNVLASAFVLLGITALAGQTLGNRGILVFGCLGFIAQVGKLIAGLQGWGMPEISLLELKSDVAVSLLFYCLLCGMLWAITRSLSTALQQSQQNEILLQEKNAVLQNEIRERTQAQAALQASENNYRQLLEQAADGILIFDANGVVISANSRGCEIFGVSREELLQLSVRDLFSTHELPSLRERVTEMQKGKTFIIERVFTRRDGIQMSVETSSKMLDQGQFLAIVRDITARKETEKSLNQQHARLKALHDIALALFIVQDDEALMEIILNQAMQMLGVTLSAFALADANNQIVARKVRSSLATVDTETLKALQNIQSQLAIKAYQTLQPAVFEDYEGKEGCRIHENVFLYASACIPMLVSGKCVGILAFGQTRPQARFTPEDIQMGVLLAQLAAVALNNIQLLRESQMLAQNETLLNSITRTILKTTDFQEMFTSVCKQLAELFQANSVYLTRWDQIRQQPIPTASYGAYSDSYTSMSVPNNEKTMTSSVLEVGRTLVAEDVYNSPYISPRIAAQFPTRAMLALPLIAGEQKLGAIIISFHEERIFHADEIALSERVAQQISLVLTRVNSIEALRQSEANLQEAQRMAHIGNFEYDIQSRTLYWSEELYRIFGLDPANPITPEFHERVLKSHDYEQMIETTEQAIRAGKSHQLEQEITLPSGEQKYILVITRPVMDAKDQLQRVFGIVQDVTEMRYVEKALRVREERLRLAVRVGNIGIFDHNHRTGEIYWSPEEREIYGWGQEEAITLENYIEQVHPEDRQGIVLAVQKAHDPAGDGRYDVEHRIFRRDGALRWVTIRSQTVFREESGVGFPERTMGAVIDITEQKQASNNLRERETQLAIIFDNVSEYQVLYRVEALDRLVVQTMNQAFLDILRRLHPEILSESLVGKTVQEGFAILGFPSDQHEDHLRRVHTAVARLEPGYFEQALPDGDQTMILSIVILPIVDDSGMCTHLLWSGHDVTEQKKAEAQLRVSLQEKEILLKEIHHRVKNNLQVISSLLYLQSQKIKDERFIDLFRESQNRVAAMALVHEQLYQTNNFAQVNFGRYIRTLASTLFETYGVDPSQITLGINTDGSTLDVHTAIPCGLLLSEILSNALKYAFPEARHGRITIDFYEEGNICHLWVTDDGIGMPAPSHIRPGSLGLQLIERLVAQIGGSMERKGTPGTSYHIWRATAVSI